MSKTSLDLFTATNEGLNYSQTHALVGKLLRGTSEQAVALGAPTTLLIAGCAPLQQDSGSPDISFVSAMPAAVGESMTIDIRRTRAGVASSILTGVYTFNHASVAGAINSLNALIDPAKMPLLAGDVLDCVRTLVGGATMANNSVIVEPRPTVVIPNNGGAV